MQIETACAAPAAAPLLPGAAAATAASGNSAVPEFSLNLVANTPAAAVVKLLPSGAPAAPALPLPEKTDGASPTESLLSLLSSLKLPADARHPLPATAGEVTVSVSKDGYQTRELRFDVTDDTVLNFSLTPLLPSTQE